MIQKSRLLDNKTSETIDVSNICPHCGQGGQPWILASSESEIVLDSNRLICTDFILQCVICNRNFFAEYLYIKKKERFYRFGTYPSPSPQLNIPEEIKDYYPEFYETFRQSTVAEFNNLHEVAGMAFRKSIEYLVKKYCIDKAPELEDIILKEKLGQSINRLEFPQIKNLAKAAVWIGNDQTHIIQKNPNYNIDDMKGFIVALVHLIISEKVADKALAMIQK